MQLRLQINDIAEVYRYNLHYFVELNNRGEHVHKNNKYSGVSIGQW